MNNYLSNLVEKTLNQVPLARPHRAPLFAPTPYASGALGRPEPTASPFRLAREEEENAPPDARHDESPHPNLREARAVSTVDDGTHARGIHRRAGRSEAELESGRDEAREGSFAASPPTLLAPPPKQPPHTPRPISSTAFTEPRETNDETQPETLRNASSARDESGAAQRRLRPDSSRREADAAAHEAAARETEAALGRLRERLNRDEREAHRLESEFADARRDVRKLDANSFPHERPQVRATRASEGEAYTRGVREGLREDAASARRAKPVAPQDVRRPAQLKPVPVAAFPSRRNMVEEDHANEAAPTIQVTIGRIEVRATQPATPAHGQRRAVEPQLSLEEYLRRRNGGAQ